MSQSLLSETIDQIVALNLGGQNLLSVVDADGPIFTNLMECAKTVPDLEDFREVLGEDFEETSRIYSVLRANAKRKQQKA